MLGEVARLTARAVSVGQALHTLAHVAVGFVPDTLRVGEALPTTPEHTQRLVPALAIVVRPTVHARAAGQIAVLAL